MMRAGSVSVVTQLWEAGFSWALLVVQRSPTTNALSPAAQPQQISRGEFWVSPSPLFVAAISYLWIAATTSINWVLCIVLYLSSTFPICQRLLQLHLPQMQMISWASTKKGNGADIVSVNLKPPHSAGYRDEDALLSAAEYLKAQRQ